MKIFKTGLILVALFLAACTGAQTNSNNAFVKNVTAIEFNKKSQEKTILDVRTPEEFGESKIESAKNINFYDADFIQQVEKLGLDKEAEVYVYCKSGGRSSSAAKQLSDLGYTKVYNLSGGIIGWINEGFEVE